jgi:hypothetical protein
MKKTNRSTPSPAPATKPAAAAKRAVAAPGTVAAVKVPATTAAKRVAATPPAAPPRFEPAAAKKTATVISARLDVGFGNRLYLRGEGAGLAWHQGTPLENLAADLWSITLPAGSATLRFKFLLNDEIWSVGEDYISAPGIEVTLSPAF